MKINHMNKVKFIIFLIMLAHAQLSINMFSKIVPGAMPSKKTLNKEDYARGMREGDPSVVDDNDDDELDEERYDKKMKKWAELQNIVVDRIEAIKTDPNIRQSPNKELADLDTRLKHINDQYTKCYKNCIFILASKLSYERSIDYYSAVDIVHKKYIAENQSYAPAGAGAGAGARERSAAPLVYIPQVSTEFAQQIGSNLSVIDANKINPTTMRTAPVVTQSSRWSCCC